jgi:hypothetical protein
VLSLPSLALLAGFASSLALAVMFVTLMPFVLTGSVVLGAGLIAPGAAAGAASLAGVSTDSLQDANSARMMTGSSRLTVHEKFVHRGEVFVIRVALLALGFVQKTR